MYGAANNTAYLSPYSKPSSLIYSLYLKKEMDFEGDEPALIGGLLQLNRSYSDASNA
jgi:hypothetical protein